MFVNFLLPHTSSSRTRNVALILALALLVSATAWAQTTVGTGSIVGTVSDPSGAVVSGAKVVITSLGTGQVLSLTTNPSGTFNSGSNCPQELHVG
jgi:hypothetical protein